MILVNNFALEQFYLYKKQITLKTVYESINEYYKKQNRDDDIQTELEKLSIKNNFDILIKDNNGINLYTTNKNFSTVMGSINDILDKANDGKEIESNDNFKIKQQRDTKNGLSYMMLSGKLENGYFLYIRIPLNSIKDSVSISNNFLLMMAGFTVLIASIMVTIVSRKFTEPILELNNIAKKMSNLDFSQKYEVTNAKDEINDLGKSINTMSEKLEKTIKQYSRKICPQEISCRQIFFRQNAEYFYKLFPKTGKTVIDFHNQTAYNKSMLMINIINYEREL